ncbi:MAG: PilZ domain-containing protein [Candidatus Omnitrophica bacterium]|nr:PilZ domain-containing protein [Candidatus Omnitrophota bacterium]MDD5552552.1 PilZ domain-containing protein [Candidatus Omnitrophota bacterium]
MDENNGFKEDRRIFERFSAVMPANLIDLDAGKELEATTCDVSAKGVGVVCEEHLTPGNRLELWLRIKDGREPLYTKGTVMWARPEEGKCRAGILLERAELMGMARILRS